MEFRVIFDWKLAVALGGSAVGIVLAIKLEPEAVKEVSIHAIDAYKEFRFVSDNNC